jgi:hypothetical protein
VSVSSSSRVSGVSSTSSSDVSSSSSACSASRSRTASSRTARSIWRSLLRADVAAGGHAYVPVLVRVSADVDRLASARVQEGGVGGAAGVGLVIAALRRTQRRTAVRPRVRRLDLIRLSSIPRRKDRP